MSSFFAARVPLSVKVGLPLAATALVAAACSSGGSGYGAAGGGSSTAAGRSAATVIKTSSGEDGTFLTDGSGRALYLWAADGLNKSTCSGACASGWPPLTATGTPSASGGASAADIATITRSDGGKQVTYNGHALYYFSGDTGAGQIKGQGSNAFGADWWLVAPDGSKITTGDTDGS